MSNHFNRDNQGGWNGGFQQGGGGFAAHNVQHRYQEDDYGGYAHPSQNQRNQAPLYARGAGSYPRGAGGGHNYGSHRGHPQMGHHQQPRREHQHGHDQNGYGNVPVWANDPSSRGVSQGAPTTRFGGFNPNAPVFTPSGQGSGNGFVMQQPRQHYNEQNSYYPVPSYYPPTPMAAQLQMPYGEFVDEETAAYEAMYSNQQEPQQFVPSQELVSLITPDPMSVRIQEVLVGLEQLMADPDDYESWSGAIRERIVMLNDDQRAICIRIMLEMLTSSASSETTHPHAGHVLARLVEMMAREMPSSLPSAILPTLQRVHSTRSTLGDSERAAVLKFMAEVFDRIETGGGSKIEALGMAVLEHAKEMIKPETMNEQRIKDVIEAVKIAGPGLDSLPGTRAANDELLTLLSAFGKGHPKLSECTKNEIAVLMEQRESGWASRMHGVSSFGQLSSLSGMGGAASSSSSSSVPAGCIVGHDGRPLSLSEEERQFLDEQFGFGDETEEDEIMREMDKFMREEKEKKQAEATQKMMEKLSVCDEKKDGQA